MKLVAEPHIPFALWLALAILALAVMVWYGLTNKMSATRGQKTLILALMSTTLALPLLVLLNLTWIQNVPPPAGKPVVRVLIDTSASMATADIEGQPRIDRAQELAKSAASVLGEQFDVRVSTFDEALKPSDFETEKPPSPTNPISRPRSPNRSRKTSRKDKQSSCSATEFTTSEQLRTSLKRQRKPKP